MRFRRSSARTGQSYLFLAILSLTLRAFAGGPVEQVLYRFQGGTDGIQPLAGLLADGRGNLYGTTYAGGTGSCYSYPFQTCGLVFQLSPRASGGPWVETIIHDFQGGTDGSNPQAPLITDAAGNLYGTTSQGGSGDCGAIGLTGCGTVFELSPSTETGAAWSYQVLYSFQGVLGGNGTGDTASPNGIVLGRDGSLYGFADTGGSCVATDEYTDCTGAAFRLQKSGNSWKEEVISLLWPYFFPGSLSGSPVLDRNGNLYGTAWGGGKYGWGGVFRLEPPKVRSSVWTVTTVYDLHGKMDGGSPTPGLVFDDEGNLYGACFGDSVFSVPNNVFQLRPTSGGTWATGCCARRSRR